MQIIWDGFIFNELGELTGTPDGYTLAQLQVLYKRLISAREYIRASRIQHLINTFT